MVCCFVPRSSDLKSNRQRDSHTHTHTHTHTHAHTYTHSDTHTYFCLTAPEGSGDFHCKTFAISSVPLSKKSDTFPYPAFLTSGVRIPVASFPSWVKNNSFLKYILQDTDFFAVFSRLIKQLEVSENSYLVPKCLFAKKFFLP